ncbi:PREDICTED: zinc finger protein 862-like isoform X2 [Priapulus caudatus]|uniref:Zinc finger protein 862-like isoform X2 n=1 Tax=Priapulus caudatus TaxID=37621 RepID=A0ABM1E977_PRICU|nr:PREDICTED: zinc finger protein 862-like isoform X2 [Priapulus caudatus]
MASYKPSAELAASNMKSFLIGGWPWVWLCCQSVAVVTKTLHLSTMWRFLDNCEPPAKKNKQTSDKRKEKQREYETNKRSLVFKNSWITEFEWLLHDGKCMYCRPCQSAYGPLSVNKLPNRGGFQNYSKGAFVNGCANFKHSALTNHQNSDGHSVAVRHVEARNKPTGTSQAEQTIKQLNKSVFHKLETLFRNAHAIAVNCRPFSDYNWMATLDEKKGMVLGETYRNDKACKQFVTAISDVERERIVAKLSENKFLTVISDGSTDTAILENEVVYCRTARLGQANTYFCAFKTLERGDANCIYQACTTSLVEAIGPNSLAKLVGFAADGASVNTGHANGVIAKLRGKHDSSIIMVKCLVHRLELAYKEALKGAVHDKLVRLLAHIFTLYHKSPLQRTNLRKAFDSVGIPVVMPTRIGGTRWLGHTLLSLEKLWKGYKAIVMHLTNNVEDPNVGPKARGLLKLLQSKAVIHYGHFLQDVLLPLSKLSKVLQNDDSSIYLSHEQLESAKISLTKLEQRPGSCLKSVTDDHESEFQDFGDSAVNTLTKHWKGVLEWQGVDVAMIPTEWDQLKQLLYQNEDIYQMSWQLINRKYKAKVPHILDLVDLILSLPATSAVCERGFSIMKIMKTSLRNKLKASSMTQIMLIRMHSASIEEFDPTPAIHKWNAGSSRRPLFKASIPTKLQTALETAAEETAAAAEVEQAAESDRPSEEERHKDSDSGSVLLSDDMSSDDESADDFEMDIDNESD